MNVEEKRRRILEYCDRFKGHWVRVYFVDGRDMRLKAAELAELVRKNQLDLTQVKEVEDETPRKFKPMPQEPLPSPKQLIPLNQPGSGSQDSGQSKNDWKRLSPLLEVLLVVVFLVLVVGRVRG